MSRGQGLPLSKQGLGCDGRGAQSLKGTVRIISCLCTIFWFNLYTTYLKEEFQEAKLGNI